MSIDEIKTAARSGDPKAAFDLGWCYYIGRGVVQNKSEAWKWYADAAAAGVLEAKEIVHILEAEAQRDLEFKILISEPGPSPRRRSALWLAIIPIAVVCIGSIAVLLHVFDYRSAIRGPDLTEERGNLRQEKVISEDLGDVSVVARGREAVLMEHEAGSARVPVKSETQMNQPANLKRDSGPLIDFNELAQYATKWLEDANEVSSAGQPTKSTDQKRRSE